MNTPIWIIAALLLGCSSAAMPADGAGNRGSGGISAGSPSAVDGAAPSPVFPESPLSTFKTSDDALRIELRTLPDQPIHVGPGNEAELKVFDGTSGEPVDGLDIKVSTWMPVMGHKCSEAAVHVRAQGGGVYLLTPLVASMPGKCELELNITIPLPDGGDGEAVSVVSPTFQVEQ